MYQVFGSALVLAAGSDDAPPGDCRVAAMTAASAATVASRVEDIRRRVAGVGGDPDRIRIVAVTKGFGPEAVVAAVDAGIEDVGENYAQELLAKAATGPSQARWHFLGPVQRNKVAKLAPVVRAWHGIDRPAEADAVAGASPAAEVFVQVNVTGESTKAGCAPGDVADIVAHCRELPLDVSGLMAVGPVGDPEGTRECFRWLAQRARQLGLRELSMGMSDDFEAAVLEGATTLRLGRVVFGSRPGPATVQR
jgi:pyridoxal phosphate enzyme (YggS family)